ncbi:hypothetical protein K2Z84_05175 [Candidatus Binatia bacterium]|nr:hypothetical protein [Candidatus Binatia bacterium]
MGRDANHRMIQGRFEKEHLASTADLSGVGKGVPDIVVGYCGLTTLVEIKLPEGRRGGTAFSKLNHRQVGFHSKWRGMTPFVARTDADVDAIAARIERLGAVMREIESLPDDELESLALELRQRFREGPSASSLSA